VRGEEIRAQSATARDIDGAAAFVDLVDGVGHQSVSVSGVVVGPIRAAIGRDAHTA
jgi:hypothetical protein